MSWGSYCEIILKNLIAECIATGVPSFFFHSIEMYIQGRSPRRLQRIKNNRENLMNNLHIAGNLTQYQIDKVFEIYDYALNECFDE